MRQFLGIVVLAATLLFTHSAPAQMHSVEPGLAIKLEILEFPSERYEQLRWTLTEIARSRGSETGDHKRVSLIGIFDRDEMSRWLNASPCQPLTCISSVPTLRDGVFKIQNRNPHFERIASKARWIGTLAVTSEAAGNEEWSIGLKPDSEIDDPNTHGVPGLSMGPGPR